MALHKDLTGTDLHESKGVASAAANTLYVNNGAGSGTHQKITLASLDLTSIQNPNTYYLSASLADVSTASFVLVPIPFGSTFVSCQVTLKNAITVANATMSFVRNDAASLGTNLTVTQAGSAEGTTFTFTATTNTTISAGGYIKISSLGGSTTTCPVTMTLVLNRIP